MSPLSRTAAHAISNYAQQSGLTMDALREAAPQHVGNLRAELMQTTGNIQLFTNEVVGDMLSGLQGGPPNVDAIDAIVAGVIAKQEARMAQVNTHLGATLDAGQAGGAQNQRNMAQSPLMTQMGANVGTQPTADVASPMNQSGAAVGQQGASFLKKAFKPIMVGALAITLSVAALTGYNAMNHGNHLPEFNPPAPIELIQDQPAPSQNAPAIVVEDGAFGAGAGAVENDKEAAHQQRLEQQQNLGSDAVDTGGPETPTAPEVNDKETLHRSSLDAGGGGGGGNTVESQSTTTPAPVGSDEGVRSGGPQDNGPQDVSRND